MSSFTLLGLNEDLVIFLATSVRNTDEAIIQELTHDDFFRFGIISGNLLPLNLRFGPMRQDKAGTPLASYPVFALVGPFFLGFGLIHHRS